MFKHIAYLGFVLLLFTACTEQKPSELKTKAIPLSYARNFTLDSLGNDLLLTIGEPNGKKDRFLLSNEKPESLPNGTTWIKTPVKRILTLAGTDIGMLGCLNQELRICGVSDRSTVYNKNVLNRIQQGNISDFGQQDQLSFEQIIQCTPQILTYSEFGNGFPHHKELAKAHIICLPILDWKETHPLGKAEWIKLYGYLCGKSSQSNDFFEQRTRSYRALLSKQKSQRSKPTVFTGNQTGEIWFCPAGESYEAQLIKDAGGNYTYKSTKGTGSLSLSPEKVLTENRECMIWLNPGFNSLRELHSKHPRSNYTTAFKNAMIYCYSAQMNKYWETAACYPDKVLSDLHAIFQKKDPKGLYFYSRLK